MKHFTFLFVSALSFAAVGCKKKAPDCAAAISHSMDLAKADMKENADPKAMQTMADLGVKHCKEDKWPDDAVRCMMDAKTETDAKACYGKLSADQQKKMNDDAMGAKPADMGSAAAGSGAGDMGSAAAGSGSAMGSGSAGGDMAAGSAAGSGSGSAAAGSGSAAAGSGSAKK